MFRPFRRAASRALIDRLSGEIVTAARHPALFTGYGIADDVDGRFESLALHAALVLRRLNAMPPPGPQIAQELADSIFRSLDAALREKGVGDLSVPRHMKAFAAAVLGRARAYDGALGGDPDSLAAALRRNVYAGKRCPERLVRYIRAAAKALDAAALEDFLRGKIPFPDPSAVSAQ
ncbi:MAG: ubiquinol-cytochrome C chaperone family protein [Methylocapsa sp.]|nr:ubiquinol-cytochrome C chaperone family protein [Methylocapsa sp.]